MEFQRTSFSPCKIRLFARGGIIGRNTEIVPEKSVILEPTATLPAGFFGLKGFTGTSNGGVYWLFFMGERLNSPARGLKPVVTAAHRAGRISFGR